MPDSLFFPDVSASGIKYFILKIKTVKKLNRYRWFDYILWECLLFFEKNNHGVHIADTEFTKLQGYIPHRLRYMKKVTNHLDIPNLTAGSVNFFVYE